MAMSNPVRDLRRPDISRSTWRGYVVDTDDPKKQQRVKTRIPQLHRGIPDKDLPWCFPSTTGHAHCGSGVGRVDVPPEGALVEVWFEEDDPHNPRYGGSPPVDSVHKDNEILDEDYPKTTGEVDESGNKWTLNKQRKEALFEHSSGSSIFFDGAGNITINAVGKLSFSGKEVAVTSDGKMDMHAKGKFELKSSNLRLNSAGNLMSVPSISGRNLPSLTSRKGKFGL